MKLEAIASIYPFPYSIGHGHDVNFSLTYGSQIYSYEEAKISQIMHDSCSRLPERSMFLGFRQLGLSPQEVDHWVFGGPNQVDESAALDFFFKRIKCDPYEELVKQGRIHTFSHHKGHVYLAVATSPFQDGCFLTIDGGGDESELVDSTWGVFEDRRIINYQSSGSDNGLTVFHGYICELVGYLNFLDHGKLMGLASYAEPPEELCAELRRFLVRQYDDMNYKVTSLRPGPSPLVAEKVEIDAYNYYKTVNQPLPPTELADLAKYFPAHQIAAAGQHVFEECVCELVSRLVQRTGKKNVVLAGGAFHNVSANRRLNELGIASVYVPAGVGDEGLSLGATFGFLAENGAETVNKTSTYLTPFLGPGFSNNEVGELVQEYGLEYIFFENHADQCKFVAENLDQGKIVGWFQGRGELGARSLGARSVLADPRNVKSKARLNQLLKRRDWFMPFAPAILEGYEDQYLEHYIHSPYMTMAFKSTEKALKDIPAGVHVDETCRPNCVSEQENSKFYRLVQEFKALTGIPAVLNTSFNRHGIPTIASPRQALEHLTAGSVDILAIEDYIVFPNRNQAAQDTALVDEKIFIGFELIKPIVTAWLRYDDVEKAISLSDSNVIEGIGLRADAEQLSLLGAVFSRDPSVEERELLSKCRELLESHADVVMRIALKV